MKIRFMLGLALFAMALLRAEPAFAKNTLLDATDEICADMKKFLDGQGKNKVRIGQFVGKSLEAGRASSSPLLKESLRISLLKQNIDVVDGKAAFEVTGSFQAIEDERTGRQAVILTVTLDDGLGNEFKFQGVSKGKAEKYYFENVPDVAKVLGINSYLPPNRPEKEQIIDIKESIDHPTCLLDGTRILAAKGAPFAVEILVAPETSVKRKASDYNVKQPKDQKGLAFVPIAPKEAYAVRLYNRSKFDVAVDLCIDGLNMYYFSEKRDPKTKSPAYRYIIVPANRNVEVRGWYVTGQDSDEFTITPRANSAIAKAMASNPADVGTVTANFFRAWDPEHGRPSDESPSVLDQIRSSSRAQRFLEKYVEVDYYVGTFRGSVSVRYTK
jgi:hypothetical protein